MDIEICEEQIRKNLQNMSSEKVVFFAWLCAVRALPVIGNRGNFDYWKKEDRNKYLYAIFQTLDVSIYTRNNGVYCGLDVATVNVIFNAMDDASNDAALAHAVRATINAASTAVAHFHAEAENARSAATYAVLATVTSLTSGYNNVNMKNILLLDIEAIQHEHYTFNNKISFYGEIWDNFQIALRKEGCKYWGDLYKTIFENSFELDKKALERRMNVPKKIQGLGAAEVAKYLEK